MTRLLIVGGSLVEIEIFVAGFYEIIYAEVVGF
jgi:hypothetical protein